MSNREAITQLEIIATNMVGRLCEIPNEDERQIELMNKKIEALDMAIRSLTEKGEPMIMIKGATKLQDGLYQIDHGKIYKYKGKGGTVRVYDLIDGVECKDCDYYTAETDWCGCWRDVTEAYGWCNHGRRRDETDRQG